MVHPEIYCIFNSIESKGRVRVTLRYTSSNVGSWGEVSITFNMDRKSPGGVNPPSSCALVSTSQRNDFLDEAQFQTAKGICNIHK